ncbi:MAG: hypothetical protein A2073_07960 [Deltaproteobacteria bacterium GWC2_42_11]|nr:MAG: hypothetical protein A2073_07960 [Deltaproteobacteria bacterium GWC2_42_11]
MEGETMIEIVKHVRYGILIGLFGIIFGIGWAFWLVLGHERIHKSLEERAVERKEVHSLIQLLEPSNAQANTTTKAGQNEHGHAQSSKNEDTHQHAEEGKPSQKDEHMQMMGEGEHMMPASEEDKHQRNEGMHDSPIMELAHKRMVRGHLHAMGLGLVTIVISFLLAFTSASDRIKTIVPVLAGIGGFVYPFAWIVMGYRTPALGADGAEASVTTIAGPGVLLVLIGISTAIVFLLKDSFSKR